MQENKTNNIMPLIKKLVEEYKLFKNYETLICETEEFASPAILLNNTASLIHRLDKSLNEFPLKERLQVLTYIYPTMVNASETGQQLSPLALAVKEYFEIQKNILTNKQLENFENKLSKIFTDLNLLENNLTLKIDVYKNAIQDLYDRNIKEGVGEELINRMQEIVQNFGLSKEKVINSIDDFKIIKESLDVYKTNILELETLNFKLKTHIFKADSSQINEQNKLIDKIQDFENSLRNKSFKLQSSVNQFFDQSIIEKINLLVQKSSNGKDVLLKAQEMLESSNQIKDLSSRMSDDVKKQGLELNKDVTSIDFEFKVKQEITNLVSQAFNQLFLAKDLKQSAEKARTEYNKKLVNQMDIG